MAAAYESSYPEAVLFTNVQLYNLISPASLKIAPPQA